VPKASGRIMGKLACNHKTAGSAIGLVVASFR
jgi:hypothetical protein